MQITELFRRGIVLPLDVIAASQLADWEVGATINVEWLEIADDEVFKKIWRSGLLQEINGFCGTKINDYEEEEVPPDCLTKIIGYLEQGSRFTTSSNDDDIRYFCSRLLDLCRKGCASNRPLYFIL